MVSHGDGAEIREPSVPGIFKSIDQSFNFNSLRISAFNIQVFGVSKMEKPHVVEILEQILVQYDITLIQEIRDASETAIYELLDVVNAATSDPYDIVLSERLGRTTSKEQYAYFYRPSKFSYVKEYQWPEDREGNDWFERPPFTVHFQANGFSLGDFAYSGIHVKPDDAVAEIDHLVDVFDGVADIWGSSNPSGWIIGGDLNAGCTYVRPGDWENIRLRTESRFTWIIDDDVDTTVSPTQCAYDRFVLTGHVANSFIGGTAKAFNFRDEYGLDDDWTKEVSDHWPVEMDSA
ncbi:hypothetical protein CAPTEDRAFT_100138 [Capitella teleta]|uniref:Deoxyribonuclease n=1 Tax=Capitella teleta TaxID=283909 RepID=R7U7G4_CAPTE|nr:hypothetical protein CAPTEDRAFT_100138 [Capitella teleta]|eukprot:ELU01904.1 hypothetical protein CAPTEDRAFT_100138 [Capitella teleta]